MIDFRLKLKKKITDTIQAKIWLYHRIMNLDIIKKKI